MLKSGFYIFSESNIARIFSSVAHLEGSLRASFCENLN
jgi:hypothetical protein